MDIGRPSERYLPRLADETLKKTVERFPAVLITGPRAVGKTTTARRLATSIVRLDVSREAAAFRADADAALRNYPEPLLIDEWQQVPDVLGAVKRAVDERPQPGRFILTGSVRADLDTATWPGTGRLIRLRMEPMTLPERTEADLRPVATMIHRLFEEGSDWLIGRRSDFALDDYLDAAFAGGWPPVLDLAPVDRSTWLQSYIDHIVRRDAQDVDGGRDPERLRRWLRAYASATGTVTDQKRIYDAAGVAKATGEAYDELLSALMIVSPLPAWWTNELKRLARRPKLYVIDPAILQPLIGIDRAGAMRTGMIGQVIETFVVAHLRAMAGATHNDMRLYHLRDRDGREVDVIAERADRRIVAIEVKSTSAPSPADARHLRWFKERQPNRCAAAILVHTGPTCFDLGHGIVACPIGVLIGLHPQTPHL